MTARTSATFSRQVEDIVQHVTGYFASMPQMVSNDGHRFDIDQLASDLSDGVDNFNSRGSGFVIDGVTEFTLVATRYRPLSASSYIPTPPYVAKKQAVINVKNNDLRCFEWAVLSSLYPDTSNANRVCSYTKYRGNLNFDGIAFPVRVKDIDRFEKLNIDISVNVMSLDEENKGFCIERMSSERHRKHHVNLLLLSDEDKNQHYVWIKNFSRVLGERSVQVTSATVVSTCFRRKMFWTVT